MNGDGGGQAAVTPTANGAEAAHIEAVVRRSGTSFYWAMRLLPQEKRQAMFAVYAFCREVDDIADDPGEATAKRDLLGQWREEIDDLFAGVPRHPVTEALARSMRHFDLRREDFLAIIAGMETDAADRVRIADMNALALYCDRVACAVGRLSNRVFGLDDDQNFPLAASLGEALQLTNILRDLREDADRDRLYLPLALLRQFGIDDTENPAWVLEQPGVADVCDVIARKARQRFREASAILATCDRRQTRPALIMRDVYHRILHRVIRRGWRQLADPVSLSRAEKLWVAVRYGFI